MASYAYVDEVWGSSHKQGKSLSCKKDTSCELYKRRNGKDIPLDDIMNAYMDESPYDKYEIQYKKNDKFEFREQMEHDVRIKADNDFYDLSQEGPKNKCYDEDVVQGTHNPILDQSYKLEQYYEEACDNQDATSMNKERDNSVVTESTPQDLKLQTQQDLMIEHYINELKSTKKQKNNYLDLILYVASGILLIFMMEQLLQLGMFMKSKSR